MNQVTPIPFEPTNAFCYRLARYHVLPAIIAREDVQSGKEFRLVELVKQVVDGYLTPEQQIASYARAKTGELQSVIKTIKWYVPFVAKNTEQLIPIGEGMYRIPTATDIDPLDVADSALEDGDSEATDSEGFIYAFSFPELIRKQGDFPIKIGMTSNDVAHRVAHQCKGSAIFDNPTILAQWKVNRVGFVESAIHKMLAARGKWREHVPGTEWFDTTIEEIKLIIDFTGALRN